jgi:hypothetical protein
MPSSPTDQQLLHLAEAIHPELLAHARTAPRPGAAAAFIPPLDWAAVVGISVEALAAILHFLRGRGVVVAPDVPLPPSPAEAGPSPFQPAEAVQDVPVQQQAPQRVAP